MKIEIARVSQSKQLAEVLLTAAEALRGVDFTAAGWDRFIHSNTAHDFEQKLCCAEFSIFCCVESDRVVGFIALKNHEKIDQLFVIPAASNRGVATALWQAGKINALEQGAPGTFWVRSSTYAVPVYKKFGFVCEGERQSISGISFQLMRL